MLTFIPARLLYSIWFHQAFERAHAHVDSTEGQYLSIQKLADFLSACSVVGLTTDLEGIQPQVIEIIQKLCLYEKRRDRANHFQKIEALARISHRVP